MVYHLFADRTPSILLFRVIFFAGPYPEPYMLGYTSDGTITAIDLTTLDSTVVLSELENVHYWGNLAVEYVDRKLYFNHRGRIFRANFDGSNMEIIKSEESIRTFAIDWIGRMLFFVYDVYGDYDKIYMGPLDFQYKRVLLNHRSIINSLTVDPNEG